METPKSSLLYITAAVQGFYYLFTGVWPLIDIDTFMFVTGPKTDIWLVRTVGALILAVAIPILTAWYNGRITFDIVLIAVFSALGLTLIDIIYVLNGTISPIYLLDAAAELPLIICWIIGWKLDKKAKVFRG